MPGTELTYCIRDLDVETRLRCNKCDSLICYRCLVQTVVGSRCPECADVRRLPVFAVDLTSYVKSFTFGVVTSISLGALWGLLFGHLVAQQQLANLVAVNPPHGLKNWKKLTSV